jgi:hypothetical protein
MSAGVNRSIAVNVCVTRDVARNIFTPAEWNWSLDREAQWKDSTIGI